jgi:hypothetical protein
MKDVVLALPGIALTIVCWGTYGPVLHKGQALLGDRLKPLMCVGLAYFIFAIVVPTVILSSMGSLTGNWNFRGITWSTAAGTCGAIGALGTILAMASGGKPIYVMPLVFGGAPIVNVLMSMYFQGLRPRDVGGRLPFFLAGVIMVAIGAAMVLIFAPKGPAKGHDVRHETKPVAASKTPVDAAPYAPPHPESNSADSAGKGPDSL